MQLALTEPLFRCRTTLTLKVMKLLISWRKKDGPETTLCASKSLTVLTVEAQGILIPLQITPKLGWSSAIAEYQPNHIHAG